MPCGLLIWQAEKMAVAADLHLEKASHFAARGQMLPPHDSLETLTKLKASLEKSGCERLLLLGDSFHDSDGLTRMPEKARQLLQHITTQYETIWILGNHDPVIKLDGITAYHDYKCRNIVFRHEADTQHEIPHGSAEISGHYHPKCSIKHRGNKISRPCFVASRNRLILPAYGTLTGGLDIHRAPLKEVLGPDISAYLLGQNRVYALEKQAEKKYSKRQ